MPRNFPFWVLFVILSLSPLNAIALPPTVSNPDPADSANVTANVSGEQILRVYAPGAVGGIFSHRDDTSTDFTDTLGSVSGDYLLVSIPYSAGQMTDNGTNYWYVTATSSLVNPDDIVRYPASGSLSFTVTPTPPSPPVVSDPDPVDTSTVTAGSTGQWLRINAPGATSGVFYHRDSTTGTFTSTVAGVNVDNLEALIPYVSGQMDDNGTNYWYVEATNAGGTSRYPATSGNLSFTVTPPPPEVSNPEPGDGTIVATGGSSDQLLRVYAPGATGGTIYHHDDTTTAFTNTAATPNAGYLQATIPFASGKLTDNGTNSWYVEATNAGGTTTFPQSGSLSFTATTDPPVVSNPEPANSDSVKANGSVQLLRILAPGASGGTIYYDVTDTATLNFQTAATVNGNYLEAMIPYVENQMNKNGTNYWYVEATNANGTTRYPASGNLTFDVTYTFPWAAFLQNFQSGAAISGLTATRSPPAGVVSIKVYPEHVGIFTTVGKQQYVVFGTKQSGEKVNVTAWSSCSVSDSRKAIINSTKLVTLLPGVTSGQAKITCTFESLPSNSTSLTIVHLTQKFYGNRSTGVDVSTWPGSWPSAMNAPFDPLGKEVYLFDAQVTGHSQNWLTRPWRYPYPPFPNGLNAMIANAFSTDGGKTFQLHSWDYLAPTNHGKGGEGTWPNCWIGTMVHSFCDLSPGYCNGRNRTNLYFSAYNGDPNCWGAQIMK